MRANLPPASRRTARATGTAARPGSGAFVNQSAVGSIVNANVNITARPLTKQGLGGVRTKTGVRQVANASLEQAELRNKTSAMQKELLKIREETALLNKKVLQAANLERRNKEVEAEIRVLKDTIFDLSEIQTAVTRQTGFDHIDAQIADQQQQAAELERVLAEAGAREHAFQQRVASSEGAIAESERGAGVMVAELGMGMATEYEQMQAEIRAMEASEKEVRAELRAVEADVVTARREMQHDPAKARYVRIKQSIEARKEQLKAANDELQTLETELVPTGPAEKDRAISRMNELKGSIGGLQRTVAELKAELAKKKELLAANDDAATREVTDKVKRQLIRKVAETEAKIAQWPAMESRMFEAIEAREQGVVETLNSLGAAVAKTGGGTSLEDRLKTKTAALESIQDLGGKLAKEIAALDRSMVDLQAERDRYADLGDVRAGIDKDELRQLTIHHAARTSEMTQTLSQLGAERRRVQQQVERDPRAAELASMEQRLGGIEQQIAAAEDHCIAEERRMEFSEVKGRCMDLVGQLNAAHTAHARVI